MRFLLTFTISALLATGVSAGALYKYVDASGQVHYTDRPVEGAQRVEVRQVQTYSAPKRAADPAAAADPKDPKDEKAEEVTSYSRVSVTTPASDAVIVNTGGIVKVQVQTEPALAKGHTVRVLVDGEAKGSGTQLTVSEVFRGGHTVSAEIVDEGGRVMLRSESVNFFVRQQSRLFN